MTAAVTPANSERRKALKTVFDRAASMSADTNRIALMVDTLERARRQASGPAGQPASGRATLMRVTPNGQDEQALARARLLGNLLAGAERRDQSIDAPPGGVITQRPSTMGQWSGGSGLARPAPAPAREASMALSSAPSFVPTSALGAGRPLDAGPARARTGAPPRDDERPAAPMAGANAFQPRGQSSVAGGLTAPGSSRGLDVPQQAKRPAQLAAAGAAERRAPLGNGPVTPRSAPRGPLLSGPMTAPNPRQTPTFQARDPHTRTALREGTAFRSSRPPGGSAPPPPRLEREGATPRRDSRNEQPARLLQAQDRRGRRNERTALNPSAGIFLDNRGATLRFVPPERHVPRVSIPNEVDLPVPSRLDDHDTHIYEYTYNMGPGPPLMEDVLGDLTPGFYDRRATRRGVDNNAAPIPGDQEFWDRLPGNRRRGPAGVRSYAVQADDGQVVGVNMAYTGHALQGIVLAFETRRGDDRILHFYGFGGGPIQDPHNPVLGQFGNMMDESVWTDQAVKFGWNGREGLSRVYNGIDGFIVDTIRRDERGNRYLPWNRPR